jgi:hypothetical protein
MHEPYTFDINEIETKTRFGNSRFLGEKLPSFDNVWKKKKKNLSKTSNQISPILNIFGESEITCLFTSYIFNDLVQNFHQLNQNLFMMVRHYCYTIYIYIYIYI